MMLPVHATLKFAPLHCQKCGAYLPEARYFGGRDVMRVTCRCGWTAEFPPLDKRQNTKEGVP